MTHPTQIFLHNPCALRAEFRLDDQRLELWWSPKAGESWDCRDRNFSNRDNHLTVFEEITLPGCEVERFLKCDYDPYHCVLHFTDRIVHLAILPDAPVVLLWADKPQVVEFKTARYDEAWVEEEREFTVRHAQPSYTFEFSAQLGAVEQAGPDKGKLRHSVVHAPWNSYYARAELSLGQVLAIGVGLEGQRIADQVREIVSKPAREHLAEIDRRLLPFEEQGLTISAKHPDLDELRRLSVRILHSMIDHSGGYRASLKAIYYLIWIRDSGFSFCYQAAAGWPYKLRELCRLLLENPATARGEGIPKGRMFAQLINRDYGKYEEDGLFYVVWTLFTYWTQTGDDSVLTAEDWALLEEALDWLERYIFEEDRGLFGQHFADETPTWGARDHGWDYAIGKPTGFGDQVRYGDQPVTRIYDHYINLLMHSTYTMLAAMTDDDGKAATWRAKAAGIWEHLAPLCEPRNAQGCPPYGEFVLGDGSRVKAEAWSIPIETTYLWGLTLPNFAPVDRIDAIRAALFRRIVANPECVWVNSFASLIAEIDTWVFPEEELLTMLLRIKDQSNRPGKYLPMGGAMPEKIDVADGHLYHDIRPQGFAIGSWLAGWASLGVRRLPYGLALRPTQAFETLRNYSWRGKTLHFGFEAKTRAPVLEVNGETIHGSLQVPEAALTDGENTLRLVDGLDGQLLLRSNVQLDRIERTEGGFLYHITCRGISEMTFSRQPAETKLGAPDGADIAFQVVDETELFHVRFTHVGQAVLLI